MKIKAALALGCALTLILAGCQGAGVKVILDYEQNETGQWDINKSPLNGSALMEDKSVYESDDDSEIVELYLTVKTGKDDRLKPVYTFDALNSYTGGGDEPYCEVIFQEGADQRGPKSGYFAYGETIANGRLELDGDVTTIKPRSYKVKLYSRAGLWRGVKSINLSKGLPDLTRMKNKLGFDAAELLPEVIGLRTVFVRLFIYDTTGGSKGYKDYGLYTYIEQPNKTYLTSHGFDADGNLYRARSFNFSRYAGSIMAETDEGYNKDAFEKILRIREGSGHEKLTAMLDALNDYSKDINDITSVYFNEENIFSFAALNVLFGNYRLMYDNFLIYSPQNTNTWYLMPADFENALERGTGKTKNSLPDDFVGLPMLYESVLFRRFFSERGNIEKLDAKIEEMHKIINGVFVKKQTELYRDAVLPRLYSMPDLTNLPKAADYVAPYISELPGIVEDYYRLYKENAQKPVPPYLTVCEHEHKTRLIKLEWSPSDADAAYTIEIARDRLFLNVAYTQQGYTGTSIELSGFKDGIYYVRITAVLADGASQKNANIYTDPFGQRFYGLTELTVD